MNFLTELLRKKDGPIKSYEDFWAWFMKHERKFHNIVRKGTDIESKFFDRLAPKLNELGEGYFYMTGMVDDSTAELIITADGEIKHFVFVEEIIACAPAIPGWKFTAHKPALSIENVSIRMGDFKYDNETLSFHPTLHPSYPDEIEVTVICTHFNESYEKEITSGVCIFLDNYLGELNFATTIDTIHVAGDNNGHNELIPINKLKDYLIWRQKEFVEKYEDIRYNTENDKHSILEAELENGNALIAVINTDLLEWESKASHPWILFIEIKYNGTSHKGMPDNDTYNFLSDLEDELLSELKDYEGALYIGRQTSEGIREIYFACRDFRAPSKSAAKIVRKFSHKYELRYDIYKDKYWQSFNRFRKTL